jgi:hypothetical protein
MDAITIVFFTILLVFYIIFRHLRNEAYDIINKQREYINELIEKNHRLKAKLDLLDTKKE